MTHKYGAGGRADDTVQGGVVGEVLEPAPEGAGSRLTSGGSGEEAAEVGDPADGLNETPRSAADENAGRGIPGLLASERDALRCSRRLPIH